MDSHHSTETLLPRGRTSGHARWLLLLAWLPAAAGLSRGVPRPSLHFRRSRELNQPGRVLEAGRIAPRRASTVGEAEALASLQEERARRVQELVALDESIRKAEQEAAAAGSGAVVSASGGGRAPASGGGAGSGDDDVYRTKARIDASQFSAVDFNYGFITKSRGVYLDSVNSDGQAGPPGSLATLAWLNLRREWAELVREVAGQGPDVADLDECLTVDPEEYLVGTFDLSEQGSRVASKDFCAATDLRRDGLDRLVLSNRKVYERELEREATGGGIEAPLILKVPYVVLCWVIDVLFEDRPIPRFWFLETVARMPYFSYITMLHGYETLGFWRRSAEVKKVHFAEEWNEFHHLLIFEALGGDQRWSDRFFAQHSAVVYYLVLVVLWLVSPTLAYNFSELIEAHAVDTYEEFRDANKELLSTLPAPAVARQYYSGEDMYYFDEFQSCRVPGSRRPEVRTLYDVVSNIALDEAEHVNTMRACQDPSVLVKSPNTERSVVTVGLTVALAAKALQNPAVQQLLELDASELSGELEVGGGAGASLGAASLVSVAEGALAALAEALQAAFPALKTMLASAMGSFEGELAEGAFAELSTAGLDLPDLLRQIADSANYLLELDADTMLQELPTFINLLVEAASALL